MAILTSFTRNDRPLRVHYVETQQVKEGVECDIYTFPDDNKKDLAIVRVTRGFKTPLQRVLQGKETVEGFISGHGILTITAEDKTIKEYAFPGVNVSHEVIVGIGQVMQWQADDDLTFYEICEPPYEDGRFENIL